jgi:hypothetical protein
LGSSVRSNMGEENSRRERWKQPGVMVGFES